MALSLSACGTNYEKELAGSWYAKGNDTALFTFYTDGTCNIHGEYGTGKWSIVNDNLLKISNFYGETETLTIIDIKNGCLTVSMEGQEASLYDKP